uniref:Secreted protein n=1 Tax=Anopheles albimanus TaxID=7167 RepID=A0A182F769_ANOAL
MVHIWQPVLLLLLGLIATLSTVRSTEHVDIFEQFENENATIQEGKNVTEEADPDDEVQTQQPTSCVEDVLPSDPVVMNEKLEKELEPPAAGSAELQKPPNLPEMFTKLSSGFLSPNIFRIGENVKKLLIGIREKVQSYGRSAVAKFEQLRHQAVQRVKQKMDEVNAKVRERFENEFVEYRDVCLPDENSCMKLLQARIGQYEEELRQNMEQCNDRFAEELAKQRQSVDEAQRMMDGPFRKIDNCLDRDAGLGRSFLTCVGSAMGNLAKGVTAAQERLTQQMRKVSGQLTERVDKYDQCVVKRRRLLEQSERQLSESAKGCLKKQQTQPEDFF